MRPVLLGSLAALLLAAVAAQGEPQEGSMLHVQKIGEGDYRYIPAEEDVYAGSTVVLGHLFARHSLTSSEGLFNSTGDAAAWPTIVAPDQPGTYRFYCWLHADADTDPAEGMAGVLRVHARPGADPGRTTVTATEQAPASGEAVPEQPSAVPAGSVGLVAGVVALAALAMRRR